MTVRLDFVSELPNELEFQCLMKEYYQTMEKKLMLVGGPRLFPDELVAETMNHISEMLPPYGRLLLARGESGALIGCGAIRKISGDAAELKRMYVRPEAQGLGIGRKLFDMRIAEALAMGCSYLFADTVNGNRAMLSMYEKHGFEYTSRYPGNANGPELEPFLVYLRYQIS